MEEYSMRVLYVNKKDLGGGAARIAFDLLNGMSNSGVKSNLVVDIKSSEHEFVHELNNHKWRNPWTGFWQGVRDGLNSKNIRIIPRLAGWMGSLGEPKRIFDEIKGIEDFNFPGTHQLLKYDVDIVHLHNLHTDYFDLRKLPEVSSKFPTVITLHDAWLLTGHCAYFLSCRRWKMGCGECPYLDIYVPIKRDASAYNWERKRNIYRNSNLFIVTPSNWLMRQVEQSMLKVALNKSKVINNGVDLDKFKPGSKEIARRKLNLPNKDFIMLFVGKRVSQSLFKNYKLIEDAIILVAQRFPDKEILFINLGEDTKNEFETRGIPGTRSNIRYYPYQSDIEKLVNFYQASDVYLHAARAENFPTVILEAMACELPVIATSIGGIPEQVVDGETGFLVPGDNALEFASKIGVLISNPQLLKLFGKGGRKRSIERFGLRTMVKNYLDFYTEVMEY